MIESLALSAAMMTFVSVIAGVLYFSLVRAGMNYLLHEHLVCEQTQGSRACSREFKEKAKAWLVFAKVRSFSSSKSFGKWQARLQIEMPLQRTMKLEKEMPLL